MPPSACAKKPGRVALRAGERAAHVAEQLGVGELGGQRGAVEAHERLLARARLRVEQLGDELLAGAGLAAHEHGDVARRDAARRLRAGGASAATLADDAAAERLLGGEPAVVDAQARAPRARARSRRATSSMSNGLVR